MVSKAVEELEKKLLKLTTISYDSIDSLMRKIMKSYDITAKELHYAFKSKHRKTPDNWIKGKMKKLQEDHKEIASGKKQDDEGYMARNELDSIERAIKDLRKNIKSGNQQLPAWVQSKITKARDYIDTASEYLQSDETVDEEISPTIDINKHRQARKKEKINKLAKSPNPNEASVAKSKLTGPSLPFKEEISLVEKILGEEKCGKGMYWCNTDQVCKPISGGMKVPGQTIEPKEVGDGVPVGKKSCAHTKKGKSCPVHGMHQCPMSEEKDPKGPVKAYKSPEELAKKHGVSLKEIQKQIEIGTKVEFEHTSDKNNARITALQHLDELPNYYTKLKKMETQKESNIVRDANGNVYAEFIDIINSGTIEEENPCWKGYTQVGMKTKNGKEVPNCVPVKKGVKKAKGYQKESIEEATRLQAQNGNILSVVLSWRGKYYSVRIFFPQIRMPNKKEVFDEIQKIYPGSRVMSYEVSDLSPGQPLIQMQNSKSKNYLLNNKNIGEEVEIADEKK
jgi:hypothetical protein